MDLEIGTIVDGKVTGITKFGAFVSLPSGRSGLVHISEIAHSYVNDVSDHLTEGQEVKVKIIGIDDTNRINLSIKKATEPPPRTQDEGGSKHSRPNGNQNARPPASNHASGRATPYVRPAPGPESFEDRLKQFMQTSDSKLSEMKYAEKKSTRRGGRR